MLTASNSPVTRSAPEPMSAATPATNTAARRIDSANGIRFEADVEDPVDLESAGERGAMKAPRPANAIWPSDSCPAHPVRTVSDSAQMVKAAIAA